MSGMDSRCVFIAALGVVVTMATAQQTSFHKSLQERQIDNASSCNSYFYLSTSLEHSVRTSIFAATDRIFEDGLIVQQTLLDEIPILCREFAVKAQIFKEERLATCPSVLSIMDVFSGICTEEGIPTDFFYNLLEDFQNLTITRGDECTVHISRALFNCPAADLTSITGMEGGPYEYKRIMTDRLKCLFKKLDDDPDEFRECGNKPSLKRLAIIFELIHRVGPGATFALADFGL